jgi:hypothetical protein
MDDFWQAFKIAAGVTMAFFVIWGIYEVLYQHIKDRLVKEGYVKAPTGNGSEK